MTILFASVRQVSANVGYVSAMRDIGGNIANVKTQDVLWMTKGNYVEVSV